MQLAINSSPGTGQGEGEEGGRDGGEGEERKGLSPGGGERRIRKEKGGEAEGGGMIGRGRELTVWACKMAYGGLSI